MSKLLFNALEVDKVLMSTLREINFTASIVEHLQTATWFAHSKLVKKIWIFLGPYVAKLHFNGCQNMLILVFKVSPVWTPLKARFPNCASK